jgi:hypothetical protein
MLRLVAVCVVQDDRCEDTFPFGKSVHTDQTSPTLSKTKNFHSSSSAHLLVSRLRSCIAFMAIWNGSGLTNCYTNQQAENSLSLARPAVGHLPHPAPFPIKQGTTFVQSALITSNVGVGPCITMSGDVELETSSYWGLHHHISCLAAGVLK